MTPRERQSIVWATIERAAFRPNPHNAWITLYGNTLHKLWELQPHDIQTRWNSGFDSFSLSVSCEYVFDTPVDKYSASIIHKEADEPRRIWTIHVDPIYVSKAALHNEHRRYPSQDYTRHLRTDVGHVLDGMLFHPRNHVHIEDLGFTCRAAGPSWLNAHEVRIGGGIENFYVFLFHLRYQFCLVSDDTRAQERNRLVELFTSAINGRRSNVPPAELFNFRG